MRFRPPEPHQLTIAPRCHPVNRPVSQPASAGISPETYALDTPLPHSDPAAEVRCERARYANGCGCRKSACREEPGEFGTADLSLGVTEDSAASRLPRGAVLRRRAHSAVTRATACRQQALQRHSRARPACALVESPAECDRRAAIVTLSGPAECR